MRRHPRRSAAIETRESVLLALLGVLAAVPAASLAPVVSGMSGQLLLDRAMSRVLGAGGVTAPILDVHIHESRDLGDALAALGSAPVVLAGTAGATLAAAAWRDSRGMVYCLLAVPAVAVVVQLVLKPGVARTRYGSLSYPSMHAAGATALAVAAFVVIRRRYGGRTCLLLGLAGLVAAVVGVTVGVLHSGFHEPTDVIGGVSVGSAIALLLAALVLGPPGTPRPAGIWPPARRSTRAERPTGDRGGRVRRGGWHIGEQMGDP